MSEPTVPAPPPPPSGAAGSPNTLMLVLSYLGLFALVPYLAEKNDAEVQWHSKNGLVLFGAFLVLCVALSILSFVPGANCVGCVVWPVVGLGYLALSIIGIVKAVQGQRFDIPGLSPLVDKF